MKDAKAILKRLDLWEKVGKWAGFAVCLFFGTVMTFGMHYWEKTIPREEAIPVEAVYQSCRATYSRSSIKEILVRFSDLDQQAIDSACATEELYDSIKDFVPGTKVSLLLHPNSATILDMRVGDQVFLDFDLVVEALRKEVIGFTVLGILLYLGAVGFLLSLVPGITKRSHRIFRQKGRETHYAQRIAVRQILRIYFRQLRVMLLAGLVLAILVLITGFLAGSSERYGYWLMIAGAVFSIFLLLSFRPLVYWFRVRKELRQGQPVRCTVYVGAIREDRRDRIRRAGDDFNRYILTDTNGVIYRFAIDPSVQGGVSVPVGRRLELTFLPETGFLLSVVPYLRKKEEKNDKKQFGDLFSLYLTGKYEFEA